MAKAGNPNQWHWIINLNPWIGRRCQIETVDGCYRSGTITGVQLNVLSVDGRTVFLPISVELNGDATDRMEFHRFKTFSMEPAV